MSPISVAARAAADSDYGNPMIGPVNHTAPLTVALTALTSAEIDAKGYLKPGVLFASNGTLVSGVEGCYGVVIEAHKVTTGNAAGDIAAAGTQIVIVATIGQVSQDIIEDNLGRVLNAQELAGFALEGSKLVLVT